jgi:large subunit ribosomal protein L24
MKIRKNDNVMVVAGKDKGKKGKVRFAYPKNEKLVVEGVNFMKKHTKATGQTKQAGIIETEKKIDVSDVMLVCSKCNKATRVGYQFLEAGKKVRVCRSCHEVID